MSNFNHKFKFPCLLLLLLGAALCHSRAFAADTNSTVRIGVLLPLSGELAHIGEDIRRGMNLAIRQLEKENSSITFDLIYQDDSAQIKNAVVGAKKMLDVDRVDLLVALWNMADPVAPLAEQRKKPLFAIRWNPRLSEKYDYTITLEGTYLSYTRSQVELLEKLNVTKIGHIVEEAQGWLLASKALREFISSTDKMKIIAEESYVPGQSDFSTLVSKILDKNPEIIVISGFQPALDLLIRKIKEQNPEQRIMAYLEIVDPKKFEGMPFVAQYQVEPWFKEMFKERYGEDFTSRAAHGYDLIMLTHHIYSQAGPKISSEKFLQKIAETENFSGATGALSSNKNRNIEMVPVWQIAQDGKFVSLTNEMIEKLKLRK